jgi:hypothetical protein
VDQSGARRVGGVLGMVAVVSLLLAAVAAASRPEDPAAAPALGEAPLRLIVDAGSLLLLVTAVLGLALAVWALWPRPEEELPALPRRRRRDIVGMALSAALLVVLAVWLRGRGLVRLPALPPPPSSAPGAGPGPAAPAPGAAGAGLEGIAALVALAVVLVAAFLTWRALRRRRPSGAPDALAGLRAVLDDAIEDVLAEADARQAVIAAWARLERILARHGLPRREAEAPFEYAARAGDELAAGTVSLERLADLFEWARFSLNEVTPAMREEALTGLRAVRDGLPHAA